ncbi:unnamed protein product [Moneuplotes crassus]|uniref:Uncharacterized protein n=2 Tax=Euplotes crassus TaxID=5936 RepID=A0AAD1XHG4_EUPCR|nr:unnamed protein product [Moneuplotes crassus]
MNAASRLLSKRITSTGMTTRGSLTRLPKRNLLFMRRLQNKTFQKKGTDHSQFYESTAYLSAMREFKERTSGLLKNSLEYTAIRNDIYKKLQQNRVDQSMKVEDFVKLDLDSYYINLIVVPEIQECYEIFHILQANQVEFHVEEDNTLRSKIGLTDIRKEMGFGKDDQWPFLIVDSSTDMLDTAEVQGKDNIVRYFLDLGLLKDVKTYSAYESQGIDWINQTAVPAYNLMKHTLRGKFQYYFVSKNFLHMKVSIEAGKILRNYLWKFYKPLHYHITERRDRKGLKEEIQNRIQIFHDMADAWEERLDNNRFHGGEVPDAADFKMYSLAFAHNHMFSVRKIFQAREPHSRKFEAWYTFMTQECKPYFNS